MDLCLFSWIIVIAIGKITIDIDAFEIPERLSCWSVRCSDKCTFVQLVLGSLNPTPVLERFFMGHTDSVKAVDPKEDKV